MGVLLNIGVILVILNSVSCYLVKPDNFTKVVGEHQKYYTYFENAFNIEYQRFKKTGVKSKLMLELVDSVQLTKYEKQVEMNDLKLDAQKTTCALCRAVVTVFLAQYKLLGYDREAMAHEAITICSVFSIQKEHVCIPLINLNIEIILHIIDNRPYLTPRTICGILFQSGTCKLTNPKYMDWTVNIDQNGPKINESRHLIKPIESKTQKAKDIKVIQLTDFHYDPKYVAGNQAVCYEPLCCRIANGQAEDPEEGAGTWGDYRSCDAPWNAVVDSVEHARKQHPDADYVYYTGDIVDHGVWDTSVAYNKNSMDKVYKLLRDNFKDIPVFPLIGNHESNPVNIFAPGYVKEENLTTNWLYDYSADEWNYWLPASTKETIKKGGYYSVLVHKGFRIIGLNNNECYTLNWWILYDVKYLKKQLQWLQDTLLEAERANEKVHILKHIPTGKGECYKNWAREYRKIVDRFHKIIIAQFTGHTHRDEFYIYYARENPEHAINLAFNGGSTVTYSWVNPNYIVYFLDSETYEVTNFESWSYNLTLANLNPTKSPKWFKLYSFKEDFGLKDLSPASLDGLVKSFAANKELLTKYWEYKVKKGDPYLQQGCKDKCLLNHLCQIVITEFAEDVKCDELTKIFYS